MAAASGEEDVFARWADVIVERMGEEKLRSIDVFRQFDMNGDGRVSRKEFRQAMANFGEGAFSPQEVGRVIGILDADGNNEIDYAEFSKRLRYRHRQTPAPAAAPAHPPAAAGASLPPPAPAADARDKKMQEGLAMFQRLRKKKGAKQRAPKPPSPSPAPPPPPPASTKPALVLHPGNGQAEDDEAAAPPADGFEDSHERLSELRSDALRGATALREQLRASVGELQRAAPPSDQAALRRELEAAQRDNDQLAADVQAAATAQQLAEDRAASLGADLEAAQSDSARLTSELAAAATAQQALEANHAALHRDLEAAQSDNVRLTAELAAAQDHTAALERDSTRLASELQASQASGASLQARADELAQRLQDSEAAAATRRQALEAALVEARQATSSGPQPAEAVAELQKKLLAARKQSELYRDQLAGYTESASQVVTSWQAACDDLKAKNAALQARLAKETGERAANRSRETAAATATSATKAEVERLAGELALSVGREGELRALLDDAAVELQEAQEELAGVTGAKDQSLIVETELEQERTELNATLMDYESRLADADGAARNLLTELAARDAELAEVQQLLAEAQRTPAPRAASSMVPPVAASTPAGPGRVLFEENATLRHEVSKLNAERDQAVHRFQELTAELAAETRLRATLVSPSRQLGQLNAKVLALTEELEQARATATTAEETGATLRRQLHAQAEELRGIALLRSETDGQVAELSRDKLTLSAAVQHLQAEVEGARASLQAAAAENHEHTRARDEMALLQVRQQHDITALRQSLEDTRVELDATRKREQLALLEHERDLTKSHDAYTDLKAELAELERRSVSLADLTAARAEVRRLHAQAAKMEATHASQRRDQEGLRGMVAQLEGKLADGAAERTAAAERARELQATVAELREDRRQAELQLHATAEQLGGQKTALLDRCKALQGQVREQAGRIAALDADVRLGEGKRLRLEGELAEQATARSAREAELADALREGREDREASAAELSREREERAQLQARVDDAAAQLGSSQQGLTEHRTEVGRLSAAIAQGDEQRQALTDRAEAAEKRCEAERARCQSGQQRVATLQAEIVRLRGAETTLAQEASAATARIQDLNREVEELSGQVRDLRIAASTHQAQQHDAAKARAQAGTLERDLESLRREVGVSQASERRALLEAKRAVEKCRALELDRVNRDSAANGRAQRLEAALQAAGAEATAHTEHIRQLEASAAQSATERGRLAEEVRRIQQEAMESRVAEPAEPSDETRALAQRLEAAEAALAAARAEVADWTGRHNDATREAAQLRQQLEAVEEGEKADATVASQGEGSRLAARLEESNQLVMELQVELQTAEEKIDDFLDSSLHAPSTAQLENELRASQALVGQLSDRLQAQGAESEGQIAMVTERLTASTACIASLELQLEAADRSGHGQGGDDGPVAVGPRLEALEQEVALKDEAIANLQRTCLDHEARTRELQDLSLHASLGTGLEAKYDQLQRSHEELLKTSNQDACTLRIQAEELIALRGLSDRAAADLEHFQATESQRDHHELDAQHRRLTSLLEEKQAEVGRLGEELEGARAAAQHQSDTIAALKRQVHTLEATSREMSEALSASQLGGDRQGLQRELAQLQQAHDKLQASHKMLLSSGTSRATALHMQTEETTALRATLQRTLVALAEEKSLRSELQRALQDAQSAATHHAAGEVRRHSHNESRPQPPADERVLELCRAQETKINGLLRDQSRLATSLAEKDAAVAALQLQLRTAQASRPGEPGVGHGERLEHEMRRSDALRDKLKTGEEKIAFVYDKYMQQSQRARALEKACRELLQHASVSRRGEHSELDFPSAVFERAQAAVLSSSRHESSAGWSAVDRSVDPGSVSQPRSPRRPAALATRNAGPDGWPAGSAAGSSHTASSQASSSVRGARGRVDLPPTSVFYQLLKRQRQHSVHSASGSSRSAVGLAGH